jgi:hypothetical protein
VRTSSGLDTVGEQGTLWISSTDADGLDWSLVAPEVGDSVVLRSSTGETWMLTVDAIPATGQWTVTLDSATATAPKKNEGVQVSLVRAGSSGEIPQPEDSVPAVLWAGTASAGTGTTYSRGDHAHAVPTGPPTGLGDDNSSGASSTYARSDHVHKRPTAAEVGAVEGLNGAAGLWVGTQIEYDAIGTPDPNTVYVVV